MVFSRNETVLLITIVYLHVISIDVLLIITNLFMFFSNDIKRCLIMSDVNEYTSLMKKYAEDNEIQYKLICQIQTDNPICVML